MHKYTKNNFNQLFLVEEMPREKLIKFGPENLTKIELLAIILRVGTKGKNVIELSREIINNFTNETVSRKTYEELLGFKGISKAKACQIVSVFELSRRLSQANNQNTKQKIQIKNSQELYNIIKNEFSCLPNEKVMCVYINTKNQIIKKEFIFEGSINYSIIDTRSIIKRVLSLEASGFFLIHNHPSGDTTPSQEDINITQKIKKITTQLNIRFLDHIIIGNEYYSFFENNQL